MRKFVARTLAILGAAKSRAKARTPETLEVVGLGGIAFGIGMWALPAGVIAAGVALCVLGFTLGGDE